MEATILQMLQWWIFREHALANLELNWPTFFAPAHPLIRGKNILRSFCNFTMISLVLTSKDLVTTKFPVSLLKS